MRNTSWTVVYYMGGTQQGEWRRALPVATEADAQRMAEEIERGGRCALINRTEVWDSIGLPEGAPRRGLFSRQNPINVN
jgi:hypothetical protein